MAVPLIVTQRVAALLEGWGWVDGRDFLISPPLPAEDAEPGGFILPSPAWDAAIDPSLPRGTAEVDGHRITFASPAAWPVPDGVLGRIDAALEDWEHDPDAARWSTDGPDELADDLLPGEAEYVARLPGRMRDIASDLTAMLPDSAKDAGMHFEFELAGPDADSDEHPEPIARKESATLLVSQELLNDSAGLNDLIGKVFRGEIELKPPPPPKRHRCLACWLVSLLPGHDRCSHGYLTGCEECESVR